MNKEVFISNRKRLMERLEDNSILVMFAGQPPKKSADESYPFTPNRNFYYLTGINEPDVVLLVLKRDGIVEETVFIKKADPVMERWVGKTISSEEAKAFSGVDDIKYLDDLQGELHRLIFAKGLKKVYLNLEKDSFTSRTTQE